MFTNELLHDLHERGFVYQCTDANGLDKVFNSGKPVTFYVGCDPTAKSLHVGHLLWIRLVYKMKIAGHNPIVLLGGATAKIGDPSWKDKERSMLSADVVSENKAAIEKILHRILHCVENDVTYVDNDDWLSKLKYLEFLRDYGSIVSVNKMLTMDSVSQRLQRQQHLSFLEFNYMLLQAYDFLHLYNEYNCILEMGGADQWSNIISGVDFIRRIKNEDVFGLTMPLLTNANGVKMGKTVDGAVWLDADMMSPHDFWQYWRNVDDRDVTKLLKLFTDMPLDEISKYDDMVASPEINEAKIILADSVTEFVHSSDIVKNVHDMLSHVRTESVSIQKNATLDSVVLLCNLSTSMTQARKLIESGVIKVDDVTVTDIKTKIEKNCVLTCGKNKRFEILVDE